MTSLTYLLSSPPPLLSLPVAVEFRLRAFTVAALIFRYVVASISGTVRSYTLRYVRVQNNKLRGKNWRFDEKKGEGYGSSADMQNAQRLGCHSRYTAVSGPKTAKRSRPHQATAISCLGEFKHRMHPGTSKTEAEISRLRRRPNLSAH